MLENKMILLFCIKSILEGDEKTYAEKMNIKLSKPAKDLIKSFKDNNSFNELLIMVEEELFAKNPDSVLLYQESADVDELIQQKISHDEYLVISFNRLLAKYELPKTKFFLNMFLQIYSYLGAIDQYNLYDRTEEMLSIFLDNTIGVKHEQVR